MIDERREDGVSPRAHVLSIDRCRAELHQAARRHREQSAPAARQTRKRMSANAALIGALASRPAATSGPRRERPRSICLATSGSNCAGVVLEGLRHRARRVPHVAAASALPRSRRAARPDHDGQFAVLFCRDVRRGPPASSNGGIDGCVEPQLRRECDAQNQLIDVTVCNQRRNPDRADRGRP